MSLEYEIRSALQKVEAGAVKERASGLSTLKLLLSDHSNTGEVSESLWGVVLETIARLVEKQKATYLTKLAGTGRGSSKAPLEKLAKALTEIGQDFRWLCERGKSSLKLALVKIVLNHILTVLPFKDGIFPPLATPYARALRLVLTVPSYRDHIPASAWDAIFQLCIRGLRPGNNTSSSPLDVDNDFLESSLEFTAVSSGHSKTSAVELDFARTLTSLVTSTPVDIRGHAKQLFDFLAHFFQSYTQDTHCHIPLLCTANHLLSETSLADLDEMALFLRTAIPQLLPFWENRANQNLRIQLLHSFRVALATSTTDRDEAHELSMQIADHIYDCIPRDVRSKFGFNVLPSARQAMSAVHCQMSRLPSIPSYQDWPKTCLFSPKEVLSIAHLEFFSDIYAVKLENESFAQSSNDIDTERGRMVNTPRKRVRRASVLVDISGILTMTSASNVEKLALMQILTFLFVRHKDLLIIATWNATLKLLLEFVASTDPSLQAWSLCALGTFLLMCPEEDHRLEDAFKLLWPTSMQIAAAGGANSDVAFFVLNACVYRPNFMVKVEFGDDIARLFSGRRSETPPFSSYFLREYVTWASNVRKGGPAFGSAMLQDIVLYLMSPNDAEPWRMGQSALQSLSVDICLKLIGIDFMEQRVPGRHILNSLPSNLWPRDDYIREWRMSSSNTFWDAIDSADAEKLEAVMHTSQIKHRLRAPSGVRNEDLVFNVIKSKMEEVLEDISQVQEGPSLLSPKDLVSMKTALFTVSFVTNFARLATLRAESMHTQVANLQVPLLVSKLLLCVVNILASKDLTVENQANFLSVILEFADAETETLEASVDERMTQELPSECSESGYEGTWPLSRSSVEALVDVVSKCLQACSICSSNMRDDIQSPRSAADKSSGQAATVGISHTPSYCPQVETIFGTQMGSQEISYRNYALCIRILTKLQNILWIGACSALQENKRYTLQEFVILSAPSRSYDFPFITDDLVDFVRVSSNVGITPGRTFSTYSACVAPCFQSTRRRRIHWHGGL
ncbi:hypothetical protein DFS34DRAFT_320772 [Phlyctochytrium arcticum]|nr:hypothetical protein DFS34DRAFT_320772 [Phlyctochytrium arcticum]